MPALVYAIISLFSLVISMSADIAYEGRNFHEEYSLNYNDNRYPQLK